MTELQNKNVEAAFAKIRAMFEERNNATGLEILASYEERWANYGALSERQIDWLEKQLDGSWLSELKQQPKVTCAKTQPVAEKATDDLVDLMIDEKLSREGLTVVAEDDLQNLRAAVEKLASRFRH